MSFALEHALCNDREVVAAAIRETNRHGYNRRALDSASDELKKPKLLRLDKRLEKKL